MSKQKTQKRERAKLITQHEFVLLKSHMEPGGGQSLTVPDESMTIREIMKKHVSGMRIQEALYREGTYNDTDDFDSLDLEKVKHMDLTEQDELRSSNKNKVADLEQKQKAALAAKKASKSKESQQPVEAKKEATTKEEATPPPETGESDD